MFATDKRIYPTELQVSSASILIGCFLLFLAIVILHLNKNATATSYRSIVAYILSLLYRNPLFPLP